MFTKEEWNLPARFKTKAIAQLYANAIKGQQTHVFQLTAAFHGNPGSWFVSVYSGNSDSSLARFMTNGLVQALYNNGLLDHAISRRLKEYDELPKEVPMDAYEYNYA